MTRTHGDLFKVRDSRKLAEVVKTITVSVGSEGETAKAIGVSRATLGRIRREQKATLTRATVIAIGTAAKSIDVQLVNAFHDALISPVALEIFRNGYRDWCAERMDRWAERDGWTWRISGPGLARSTDAAPHGDINASRRALMRALWRTVHEALPDVFAAFRDEMVRRHVDGFRQEVAVLRVLEPLLEASQSGYVERSWSELSAKERRDFIDAGIRRELILLDREPALARATRIATEGAHTFAREAQAATE